MADIFDHLLAPDERVVYRDPKRMAVAAWLLAPLALFAAAARRRGTHLAALAAVALLRPFVTFEEIETFLCLKVENETTDRRALVTQPLYAWWAEVIWGRRIHCADCGRAS